MSDERRNVWDLLILGLWSCFFAIGLVPELAFYAFRELAAVPSYVALVNSSAVITIALTAYLAFFADRRCRESGLNNVASHGKALEIAVLGLIAFLEIPAKGSIFEARTLLEIALDFRNLPGRYLQTVVLFVGLSKIVAWLYLYSLVLRYHALGARDVFVRIPSLFPSTRAQYKSKEIQRDADSEIQAQPGIALAPKDMEDRAAGSKQG
ncbi:MAG: hypothetical protein IID09_00795 [Candidatus Hydrogenedentes bacterium]|nr:hypothetical protein [Candidatus Hydrogenedentota bacterium]